MMTKGLAAAYNNLSTLLSAGVPILRSLKTVEAGLKGPRQRGFARLAKEVSQGATLAQAMEESQAVFPRLDRMIIHAAEESGTLPESFDLLGQWHESVNRTRGRVLSGLALPFLLIHITAMVVPLPEFIIEGYHTSDYLLSALRILALFYVPAIAITAVIRLTPQEGAARRILDHISLKLPFFLGKALYRLALSRFCHIFYMTGKTGMPITRCTSLAIEAAGNQAVADLFKQSLVSIRNGRPLSEGLSPKLPLEFRDLWRIGEEAGKIEETAEKLAKNNAESAEFWFREFARWFPRFVYVCVAIVMLYYMSRLLGRAYSGVFAI
ncbi:MAG: type II secretion system F family protein [Planctomycetota bacterium]|jgi:type IV pilus assembly protein PilC